MGQIMSSSNLRVCPVYNCKVCERRDSTLRDAVIWCTVCEEFLCQPCHDVHKYSRSSNNHDVIPLENYKELPSFVTSIKQRCNIHNELFKLYCPAHKEPCCCECASTGHKTCHGFQSVDTVVKNTSKNPFQDIENIVNELRASITQTYENRTEALKTLNEQATKINEEVRNTRVKVNTMLDNMETEILEKLSELHSTHKTEIEKVITILEEKTKVLDNVQTSIEDMKKFANPHQTFLGTRSLYAKLEKTEQNFRLLFDTTFLLRQKDAILTLKPGLLADDQNLLGKLEVELIASDVSFKKNESLGSELSITLMHDIDAVQVRTSSQFTLYDGNFTRSLAGCAFLGNSLILFPDWSDNKELLFFDEMGKNKRNVVLDKKAFDVVYVGNNSIALTFPDARQLTVLDLRTMKEKFSVSFENRCWGVTHTGDHLFVREYSVGIHCFDMDGNLIKTLPVTGYITHISSFDGKLYYTEHTPDVVHCCDLEGEEIWQLTIEGQPKGITIGKFGFVFVVLEKECKLLIISPDGKKIRELLDAENGLQEPHAVAYDMVRNKLLLVKDKTGLAELYDIIY